jgi:2'-5' RNA ligase
MTFSIWLEPISQDARYLRKITTSLAKKYNAPLFTPHITLYSGVDRYQHAEEAVRKCKGFSELRLRTANIGFSGTIWKTLFVNIKKSKNLKSINRFLESSLAHSTKYEFRPHVSLIYKKLDAKTKRQLARNVNIRRSLGFDKITIIRSSKIVSRWEKKKTIHLKKTQASVRS